MRQETILPIYSPSGLHKLGHPFISPSGFLHSLKTLLWDKGATLEQIFSRPPKN